MKIPSKLKVLGHEYEIFLDNNVNEEKGFGIVNNDGNYIKLATQIPISSREECLLHEIFEIMDFRLELKLPHDQLARMSEVLYHILKDNNLSFGKGEGADEI